MSIRWLLCLVGACCLVAAAIIPPSLFGQVNAEEAAGTRILLVAGPCKHPPGTHEAAAGARLLQHCLTSAANIAPASAEVYSEWPNNKKVLAETAAIVFTGDMFPPEQMDEPERVKADLAAMMNRGCGIVCIHFATGLRTQHVAEDGDHPLLRWLGGYYASGCPHHRSTAKLCTATIVPCEGDHPVVRGWQPFTFDDEPYWNNYFGKDGPAANVTPVAFSMLPPEDPRKETVAWAVERPDGGRGVGIVLPHYFRNWRVDELRTLVLNAICWTAKIEVPPDGVQSSLPDLSLFEPGSVDPQPRRTPKTKPKQQKQDK